MFDVKKTDQKSAVVIRTASAHELSEYEKSKLNTIEDNAQENKIDFISIKINEKEYPAKITGKEAQLELGELALKNKITYDDLSSEDVFFIKCELD